MTDIAAAVAALQAGELVAFPTETVYGLGADAANPAAVARIFRAKGRPTDHPLIVHLPDASHLSQWAREVPDSARRVAAEFWPGPVTLILKRQGMVPDAVTGGQDTVGLRVPGHPLALELLREFNGGIAAPSANRFGHVSPTTAAHVRQEFGDEVECVLDGGPCTIGIESTILDLSAAVPRILRPGMLGPRALATALGFEPGYGGIDAPRVSGSLEAHYAPRTMLRLLPPDRIEAAARRAIQVGQYVIVLAFSLPPVSDPALDWRVASGDAGRYAHDLYACLREFDGLQCDLILVAEPPAGEAWQGVRDRLQRAAAGSK